MKYSEWKNKKIDPLTFNGSANNKSDFGVDNRGRNNGEPEKAGDSPTLSYGLPVRNSFKEFVQTNSDTEGHPDPELEKLLSSGGIMNFMKRLANLAKKYPEIADFILQIGQAAQTGYQGRNIAVTGARTFANNAPSSMDSRNIVKQVARTGSFPTGKS